MKLFEYSTSLSIRKKNYKIVEKKTVLQHIKYLNRHRYRLVLTAK